LIEVADTFLKNSIMERNNPVGRWLQPRRWVAVAQAHVGAEAADLRPSTIGAVSDLDASPTPNLHHKEQHP
jgi:hypothetical protein